MTEGCPAGSGSAGSGEVTGAGPSGAGLCAPKMRGLVTWRRTRGLEGSRSWRLGRRLWSPPWWRAGRCRPGSTPGGWMRLGGLCCVSGRVRSPRRGRCWRAHWARRSHRDSWIGPPAALLRARVRTASPLPGTSTAAVSSRHSGPRSWPPTNHPPNAAGSSAAESGSANHHPGAAWPGPRSSAGSGASELDKTLRSAPRVPALADPTTPPAERPCRASRRALLTSAHSSDSRISGSTPPVPNLAPTTGRAPPDPAPLIRPPTELRRPAATETARH